MFNNKHIISAVAALLVCSCTQKEARIYYKDKATKKNNIYAPNYLKGGYVNDKENGKVRDLRLNLEEETRSEMAEIEKNSPDLITVVVKRGDSLTTFARKYNTTIKDIAFLNNIKKPYNIYAGQKIKVKTNTKNIQDQQLFDGTENNKTAYKTVIVQSGDSLLKIGVKYDTTLRELARINNISAPYTVYVGQKIKVPVKNNNSGTNTHKNTSPLKQKAKYYKVQRGDNLFYIAKKNNMSVKELIDINQLKKPYNVFVGQRLLLTKDSTNSSQQNVANNNFKRENTSKPRQDTSLVEREKPTTSTVAKVNNDNNAISFVWPLHGDVIRKFGENYNGKAYDGIAIKANKGANIKAIEDGEVIYAGNELKDLGNMIIIKHSNNWLSIYGYCDTINVSLKDKVQKGNIIGTVGKSGSVSEPQLYFAIRRGRVAVDPLKYLSK